MEEEGELSQGYRYEAAFIARKIKELIRTAQVDGFHGGGDSLLMEDLITNLEHSSAESKTAIERSIESHVMAYAAELSRVTGTVVDVDALKEELMCP